MPARMVGGVLITADLISLFPLSPEINLYVFQYFEKHSDTSTRLNAKRKTGTQSQRFCHLMSRPKSKQTLLSLQKGQRALLRGISRNDSVVGSHPALAMPPFILLLICTLGGHFSGYPSASYLPQEDGENVGRSQGRPRDTICLSPIITPNAKEHH